jgi:hypothetical protein
MEALMPGSRLRSEIDIRLGDNAVLMGDVEPEISGFDDCRTGIGCFVIESISPPVSSKNGNCSKCGEVCCCDWDGDMTHAGDGCEET